MKKEVLPQLCQVPGGQSELIWAGRECDKVYLHWLMAHGSIPIKKYFQGLLDTKGKRENVNSSTRSPGLKQRHKHTHGESPQPPHHPPDLRAWCWAQGSLVLKATRDPGGKRVLQGLWGNSEGR